VPEVLELGTQCHVDDAMLALIGNQPASWRRDSPFITRKSPVRIALHARSDKGLAGDIELS
jgi:hypothetical protein